MATDCTITLEEDDHRMCMITQNDTFMYSMVIFKSPMEVLKFVNSLTNMAKEVWDECE